MRRSQVYALDVLARDGESVTLDLHVSSGTYVRSIAAALGGHCRTLRRTAVGPFGVDEADAEALLPVSEALARLPADAVARVPEQIRPACSSSKRSRREGRPHPGGARASAPRRRDRHLRRRAPRPPLGRATAIEAGPLPTVVTFHPHPREVLGNQVSLLATLERRLELLAELGVEETLVVEFTPELAALAPEDFVAAYLAAIGAEIVGAGRASASVVGAAAILPCWNGSASRPAWHRMSKASLDRDPPLVPTATCAARRAARPAGRDRGHGRLRRGPRRHARLSDREPPHRADAARAAFGIYAGSARGERAAMSIGVNPHYGGAERKLEVFLLDFDGDLYGERLVVEVWQRLRDEAAFESEEALVAQIARDVEQTRAATRP